MTILPRAAAVALGVAATAVLVWGANARMTLHGSDRAMLRLAWSARPERIERCRQQSEEELARLPAHMRQPVVCEGASAQYRLTVRNEGRVVTEQILRGGGLRQDRRLYVFEELPLDPGDGWIEVRFDRLDPDPPRVPVPERDHDGERRAEGRERDRPPVLEAGETVPAHLVFDQRLRIRPREVILVTYSAERRALVGIRDAVDAPR
jgi:hypothetical protein